MVIKRSIPIWQVVLAVAAALGVVAWLILNINPSVDKDAILKLRAKPGGSSPAATSQYGMPKGTPITHDTSGVQAGGPGANSRMKPPGT
jgi:hypothetical protein